MSVIHGRSLVRRVSLANRGLVTRSIIHSDNSKGRMRFARACAVALAFTAATVSAQVSQWDFSGSLSSTTGGNALMAEAAAPAVNPGVTYVNSTIAGTSVQVAQFTRGTYFRATHGLPANGGGTYVNQYALLMDVMFPNTASSGWAALYQTNPSNANDGDWFIRHAGFGIGISGNYGGYVADNVWHRLALVVDLVAGTFTSYVDGQQVQQNTGLDFNGRFALESQVLFFADEDSENSLGYVNSIQLRGYAMTAAEVALLGGPTPSGIPLPAIPGGLSVTSPNGGERWPAGSAQTVGWSATNPDGFVSIDLYNGTTFHSRIAQVAMNAGQYAWTVSPYLGDSTDYTIHVTSVAYPSVTDTSDASFEVYGSIPQPATITKLPMLQDGRPNVMNLLWETDVAGSPHAVEFGINDVTENTITSVTTQMVDARHYVHTATIRPLQTEMIYKYRVRSGTTVSPTFSFRSAPHRTTPIKVATFADEQGYSVFRQHIPHIAARKPDMLVFNGDLMPDGTSISQWQDYWFGPLEIAQFSQTTPILFSRGNHDGESSIAYAYSNLPDEEKWFAFTYGNTRFIFLNTNINSTAQTDWLKLELTSKDCQNAQFRIVSFHKSPYTDLWNGGGYTGEGWVASGWLPLFEQYGVDLLLTGHTHAYLRGDLNGVMHTIVGGAGGAIDVERVATWGIFDVTLSVFHYALFEVDGNTLTWTARDLNDQVIDSFTLTSRVPVLPGDLDGDRDVDSDDTILFQSCLSGPDVTGVTAYCRPADLDQDGDVDQADFGVYQRCISGPNTAPDPHCAD